MHFAISDFLLDIAQNSVEAGASLIILEFIEENNRLSVYVSDNGKGMDEETLKKALDPFHTDGEKHKKRKVGLGLPFLMQATEMVNGEFDIKSEPGVGTSVWFTFDLKHFDCPPMGNLSPAFLSMMLFEGNYEFSVNRKKDGEGYRVSRSELIDALEELESVESLNLAKKYITSLEEELN